MIQLTSSSQPMGENYLFKYGNLTVVAAKSIEHKGKEGKTERLD